MGAPPANKEMQLTKGAKVRAARHSAGQRRCSMPHRTLFTNVPSQLISVFDGPNIEGQMAMSGRMRRPQRAALLLALFIGVAGCEWDNPSRAEVEALLARRADRQEVAVAIGADYQWDEPGDNGGLAEFLAREPRDQYKPVREALQKGRRVMYYTGGAWQQTWLFFDESEHLVGYWFNTQ